MIKPAGGEVGTLLERLCSFDFGRISHRPKRDLVHVVDIGYQIRVERSKILRIARARSRRKKAEHDQKDERDYGVRKDMARLDRVGHWGKTSMLENQKPARILVEGKRSVKE